MPLPQQYLAFVSVQRRCENAPLFFQLSVKPHPTASRDDDPDFSSRRARSSRNRPKLISPSTIGLIPIEKN
jgi:hypothetical protein